MREPVTPSPFLNLCPFCEGKAGFCEGKTNRDPNGTGFMGWRPECVMQNPWPIWLAHGTPTGLNHHEENPYTRLILERLMAHLSEKGGRASDYRVLDVGSGPNTALADCIHKVIGANVTAADVAPAGVIGPTVPYLHAGMAGIRLRGKKRQDAVVASTVWEYLKDPRKGLRNLRRVLRSGGLLVSVLHAPDTPVVRRFREVQETQRKLLRTLDRFFQEKATRWEAVVAVREAERWIAHTDATAGKRLDEINTPETRKIIRSNLRTGILEAHRQIGQDLAAGLFQDGEFERLLERNGFTVLAQRPQEALQSRYRIVTAVMKRRRGRTRLAQRHQA